MLLIVSQHKAKAVSISDVFHYMLILSYPCVPKEALNEISTMYHSVLIIDPEDLPDARDFVRKLRSLADVPIFAITDNCKSYPFKDDFDMVYRKSILSSNLAFEMLMYLREQNRTCIGEYRLAGIDTSFYLKVPTFYFHEVDLTKSERMILNYLMVSYPLKQSNENIVKHAFRTGKRPESTSIRTHISHINHKFNEICNRNIIENLPGEGYYILTPEIIHKIAKIL